MNGPSTSISTQSAMAVKAHRLTRFQGARGLAVGISLLSPYILQTIKKRILTNVTILNIKMK